MLSTTFEQSIKPLGSLRLKLIEFMRQVTYLSNPVLLSYLVDSSALADITDLIFQYPWNSALHLTVIDMYKDIFDNCEDGEIKASAL